MVKKKKFFKKEPWMLMDEYRTAPPLNPLCAGCRNNCKLRIANELECERYSPEKVEKERMLKSE